MKLKIATLFVAMTAASVALAEVNVTPELREDLASYEMSPEALATWMQDVLDQRGHACSEVYSMGGQVPRTDPETRRNVAITVSCEERSYFITVGIGRGWKVHD